MASSPDIRSTSSFAATSVPVLTFASCRAPRSIPNEKTKKPLENIASSVALDLTFVLGTRGKSRYDSQVHPGSARFFANTAPTHRQLARRALTARAGHVVAESTV